MEYNKKRAVIYCRVSTEEESQKNALEGQIKEARHAVEEKGWELVDEYIDEGKSGTTTKHRNEYNRLFQDIEKNIFDVIVIKSQDRLMRNTLEWYVFIDKITKSNKKLFFYLENKFYDPGDSLIIGIKAILAEEYSRDLSKKINNAHKNRQKEGRSFVITSKTWGYDKVNKQIVINEKEAEVVKLIYDLCIQGYGSRAISKALQNKGIKSRSGGYFAQTTVRKIIRNPLYCGDVVMNRLHNDFNSKQTIVMPKENWIIHKNAIPPIVSREIWEAANKEMDTRLKENFDKDIPERIGMKKGDYFLSSKIKCGECGETYWRRYRRNAKDEIMVYWSCSEYVTRGRTVNTTKRGENKRKNINSSGGCNNIHLREIDIMDGLYLISQHLFSDQGNDAITESLNIFEIVSQGDSKKEIESANSSIEVLKTKQDKLLDSFLNGIISEALYKRKNEELEKEMQSLQIKINKFNNLQDEVNEKREYIQSIKNDIINIGNKEILVYKLMKLVDQIIVYPTYIIIDFGIIGTLKLNVERINYRRMKLVLDEKLLVE